MSGDDLGADLELAAELVRSAGTLAARMRAEGLQTSQKTSVSDLVTNADKAAERLITERLIAERPGDGLVGEEGARRDGGRTWFVDPVDGTYNFVSGLPIWCSAVALATEPADGATDWATDGATDGAADGAGEGEPQALLGAVYQQSADELWTGGVQHPIRLNGKPVPQLVERPLSEVSVASYLHPTRMDDDRRIPVLAVISRAATVRALGSGSVELAAVAAGRLGAFVQANSLPWDWLPGAALVRAAGGVAEIVEHRGQRWCVAGNARAAADVIDALRA